MRYFLIVAALAACPAWAQFKCTGADGRVGFQQEPCTSAAKAERLVLPRPAPDDGRAHVRRAMAQGHITAGMTRAEVIQTWGEPASANRSGSVRGTSEQLVYRWARRTTYVYLRDGMVDSISEIN